MRVKQSEHIKIEIIKSTQKKRTVRLLKTKTAVDQNSIYISICNHVMITTVQLNYRFRSNSLTSFTQWRQSKKWKRFMSKVPVVT